MPELRYDPLKRRWTIVAAVRARRPRDFARREPENAASAGACPFCPGNESMTPPEVLAYRPPEGVPNGPGWQLRVVPNLYPALGPATASGSANQQGLHTAMDAVGAHEVIVITPEHQERAAALTIPDLEGMLRAFSARYEAHAANPLVAYVHPILNYGREAGASREHLHAQLFALPLVPTLVEDELGAAEVYYGGHGRCLLCDLLRQEVTDGERVVWQDDHLLLWVPFAARAPYEMWLAPKHHEPAFPLAGEAEIASLARGLVEAFGRLERAAGHPAFNLWLHSAPTRREVGPFYHWHVELQPKLSVAAGFELGTDVMVVTISPESAASELRATGGVD